MTVATVDINSSYKRKKQTKTESTMLITDADVLFKSTSERRAYRRAARSECPAALGAASGWWCRRSHLPSSAPQSPETSTVPDPPGRRGETASGEAEAERRQRESQYFLYGRKVKAVLPAIKGKAEVTVQNGTKHHLSGEVLFLAKTFLWHGSSQAMAPFHSGERLLV